MMKHLLFLLLILPLSLQAQKDEVFAKLIREDGTMIKGTSLVKLYERQIPVFNLESNSSANSTVVKFTMNQEGAVTTLRELLLTRSKLRSGEIVVTYTSMDRRFSRFKISMENVSVLEVTDGNGNVMVQMNAARIGWTYYTYTKSGQQSISSKTGWDAERRTAWTNF